MIARSPAIPAAKALLSQDGGICPADGAALTFDPWSPATHRCPRCGAAHSGERHDRWWARWQHLWNAERIALLATLAALDGHEGAAARARELLAAYGERYFGYANGDNVLGPSRLFFSTYLESIWLSHYLAGAVLLRAADQLDEATAKLVAQVADEAANLIGEFDEGHSNRQTWNNAALAAVAVWFSDTELMGHALEGRTGLLVHLTEGFRPDGLWYEGENYHLFALQGLATGLSWARVAGVDVARTGPLARRLGAALLAPARTALPDLTFPARKDSRFGVSLAQPMYLETWEVGRGLLGDGDQSAGAASELAAWLGALYAAPAPPAETFDSYLYEADGPPPPAAPGSRSRRDLSWWALLTMPPDSPATAAPWQAGSTLLEHQGLAVLRTGGRYVSLECGPYAGGHAHADRLHLTVHDGAVHWLPDPGTGTYLARDLFWYRSTLAHNAPRLDGVSQPAGAADCLAFHESGAWAWTVGKFGDLTRTVVTGRGYALDLVELAGREERVLELPWHCAGRVEVVSPGAWGAGALADEFVSDVRQFEPREPGGPIEVRASIDGHTLALHLHGEVTLLAAQAPGVPGADRATMLVARARGRNARVLTLLADGAAGVRVARWSGDLIEVDTGGHADRHRSAVTAWTIESTDGRVVLAGARDPQPAFAPFLVLEPHEPVRGEALAVDDAPALDGSLDGFDTAAPLALELEDQYRRSEEPFAGPEELAAAAWVNWTADALFLAVEVRKSELCFRPPDAPPLRLDNEPDDIHSDGLQVYVREFEGRGVAGWLIVPQAGGSLRAARAGGTMSDAPAPGGAWTETDAGYRVTLRLPWPEWLVPRPGGAVGFDLLVNEMYPGRARRAGQLVWSGGNGWVYLRGDRQDPDRMGILELVG